MACWKSLGKLCIWFSKRLFWTLWFRCWYSAQRMLRAKKTNFGNCWYRPFSIHKNSKCLYGHLQSKISTTKIYCCYKRVQTGNVLLHGLMPLTTCSMPWMTEKSIYVVRKLMGSIRKLILSINITGVSDMDVTM
jgi:hypothetical protein